MTSGPPDAASMPREAGSARITYSTEFLLSVGGSDHCKKLPVGIDASVLSELLGRSDAAGAYSRTGRWDARSSGSSDHEGDLPERESNQPDKCSANQYRHNWQNTEHDGLLGSGAFPRPLGYVRPLASNDRGSGYQLSRNSGRYQPPRPYKAVLVSRKDIDSINDETFGSFECSSDDIVEEERKRRASFELMRKEQHKAMQEKKIAPDSEKENIGDDTISLLQNSAEKRGTPTKSDKQDELKVPSLCKEDAIKTSALLPTPTTRPLKPPGFANALPEKRPQLRSSNTSLNSENKSLWAHNATREEKISEVMCLGGPKEGNQSAKSISTSKNEQKGIPDSIGTIGQKHEHPSSSQGGVTSVEYASGVLNTSKDWDNDAMDNCSIEKEGRSTNKTSCRQDNSVSILDKFFGDALSKSSGNSPSYIESQQLNTDILVSSLPESSKYAQWFPDEGSGHAEYLSSKSLLSMIVKDENLFAENMVRGPSASDDTFENKSPRSPSYYDAGSKLHFISPTPAVGILKEYSTSTDDITESVPVMTCEDLEQTMLAHVANTSSSNQQNTVQEHRAEQIAVDQHASHHLLSLLQKGTNRKGSSPLEFHMGPADELLGSDPNCMVNGGKTATTPVNNAEAIPTSVKNVTPEALFGAAFMNDLHSRDSPVSVREHTADGPNSSSKRLLFSEEGKTIPSFIAEDHHLGEQMVPFSHSKGGAFRMKPGTGEEYGNPEFPGSSREGASFDEKALEIQLPEEDNLFSVNDSLHAQNIDHFTFAKSARAEGLSPEKEVTDLNDRLGNLAPGEAEHTQILGQDLLGSHSHDRRDQIDLNSLYHLFQSKPSAQSPMNRASPMFPPTDHIANTNQQAPLNMPEAIHRGTRCSFRQDMNYMQHVVPAPGGPRVDPAAHHLMLQHMSMPGSFPPQGLPRGVPRSQPVHHMPGYRTEMSNVNSFQMHPHQLGYGEFGMAMAGPPGPEVGVNQLERLIQMELRARSKQIHPAMAGPVPGFYEPELNMNFRC